MNEVVFNSETMETWLWIKSEAAFPLLGTPLCNSRLHQVVHFLITKATTLYSQGHLIECPDRKKNMPKKNKKEQLSQLNWSVPSRLVKMVREDAIKFNKSLDGIGKIVMQNFFSLKTSERESYYKAVPNKTFGRKTKCHVKVNTLV